MSNQQTTQTPKCPKLFGAQTAGELLKELRRRKPHTKASLTECYISLCALPCAAPECCRGDC
jgi:hypothetical protein